LPKPKDRGIMKASFGRFFCRGNNLVSDTLVTIWVITIIISLAVVLYDVFTRNKKLTPVVTAFWILIIVLTSIFGVVLYYFLGRKRDIT
jgi:hypothetical protein